MDVHRARFIPYPSSAINALAFSANTDAELSKGGLKNLRLAVGRENGNIEIWNPQKGNWSQERILYGGKGRPIEGLQWIQEPNDLDLSSEAKKVAHVGQLRLFGIGGTNTVTEWDLGTGLPLRQSSGSLSDIWCFAAQPRPTHLEAAKAAETNTRCAQDIVVGCADGSIALLSTDDNDLQFARYIARSNQKSGRALSIAFKDRDTIAVGYSRGYIRIYNIRTSKMEREVSLGVGPKGQKNLLVWTLKWLPLGEIVTGDSAGGLCFFDRNHYTLYQRVEAHEADITAIACNRDGSRVFSAGMDMKTSVHQRVATSNRQYAKLKHMYYHEHDVKALAVFNGMQGQAASFVASGGLDTKLSIMPVQNYDQEYHRGIAGLPQVPPVTSSAGARLVASWSNQEVSIWRIRDNTSHEHTTKIHRLVAKIELKGDENIAATTINMDGSLIAVATSSESRLFNLIPTQDSNHLAVRKLETERTLPGSRMLQFSPNGRWLTLTSGLDTIRIYRVVREELGGFRPVKVPFELERGSHAPDAMALQKYGSSIIRHEFAPDSKVLVVSDIAGNLDCWRLDGVEDLSAPEIEKTESADDSSDSSSSSDDENEDMKIFGQRWIPLESMKELLHFKLGALVLTFRPPGVASPDRMLLDGAKETKTGSKRKSMESNENGLTKEMATENEYNLFILTVDHRLYEYNLSTGNLTGWSKRNSPDRLPSAFKIIRDRAMGAYWHTTSSTQRLYLYGSNWVFMIDTLQDFDIEKSAEGDENDLIASPKKRKYEGESGAGGKIRNKDKRGVRSIKSSGATDDAAEKKKLKGKQPAEEELGSDEEEDDVWTSGRQLRDEGGSLEVAIRNKDDGAPKKVKTWYSFAYRPILAVVPLRSEEEYLETVLVERPGWELDLPPRLSGAY